MLRVQTLSVTYISKKDKVPALRGVSFSIARGEVLGLVGESGCGKSTVALSILRLIDEHQAHISGSIEWNGVNILSLKEKELRRLRGGEIGFVFQDPFTSLNPVLRLGEHVMEAIAVHQPDLSTEEIKSRALQLLAQVRLNDPQRIYNSYPHQVSGGQRQRVMIAIAIANRPTLLIADEPTTALDTTIQKEIMELLLTLKTELNMAVLFVTHHLALLSNYADKILVLYGGEMMEYGNVKEVIAAPRHPYTKCLIDAIPGRNNVARGERLFSIEGAPPNPKQLPSGCIFHPRCPSVKQKCREAAPEITNNETAQVKCFFPN